MSLRQNVRNLLVGASYSELKTAAREWEGDRQKFAQEFYIEILSEIFDRIKNPIDWKDRVNVVMSRDIFEKIDGGEEAIRDAVSWFTGTGTSFDMSDDGSQIYIKAMGYRLGPCGDH